jgi:hypothetical protein
MTSSKETSAQRNISKTTIDGGEDYFEARANQTDMDEEGSNEQPVYNTNDAAMKSMMGTSANALDSSPPVGPTARGTYQWRLHIPADARLGGGGKSKTEFHRV